jgi:hypothetical protein
VKCTVFGLSMVGAKQRGTRVCPSFGRGAVRPAGCARGAVLQYTAVLVERGATSEAGEEEKPPSPC